MKLRWRAKKYSNLTSACFYQIFNSELKERKQKELIDDYIYIQLKVGLSYQQIKHNQKLETPWDVQPPRSLCDSSWPSWLT